MKTPAIYTDRGVAGALGGRPVLSGGSPTHSGATPFCDFPVPRFLCLLGTGRRCGGVLGHGERSRLGAAGGATPSPNFLPPAWGSMNHRATPVRDTPGLLPGMAVGAR